MCPQDLDSSQGEQHEMSLDLHCGLQRLPAAHLWGYATSVPIKKTSSFRLPEVSVSSATWESLVLSALWTLAAAAMKAHYFLLVMLFFLFSQMEPGKLWKLADGSGWDWRHRGQGGTGHGYLLVLQVYQQGEYPEWPAVNCWAAAKWTW